MSIIDSDPRVSAAQSPDVAAESAGSRSSQEAQGDAAAARRAAMAALAMRDEVDVVVEKLVAGGDGLGRWDGIPVFVPRTVPGDRVRVRLVERRPDYVRGEVASVLFAGPGRREAPCPHFSRCGGCDLQQLEDALQVGYKVAATRESLQRISGLVLPAETPVFEDRPWGYRLRAQLHVAPGADGGAAVVGYHARGSNELVPVSRCPVLAPELQALLAELPELLPAEAPRRLDLAAGDDGQVSVAPLVAGLPHGELAVAVGEFTYAFDARCFFQGHRGLLARLVDLAIGEWQGARAVDLYAGVGLFSLPLARRYAAVSAVEGDRIAVRFARTNARRAGLTAAPGKRGVEAISQAVESWIAHLPADLDRVLVDPPRAGLHPTVRAQLVVKAPRRLTYVSCHAATLARDLRDLAHAFHLESLAFVDLFPQTGHLETVVQLVRRKDAVQAVAGARAAAAPPAASPKSPERPARRNERPDNPVRRERGAPSRGDRRPPSRPPRGRGNGR